MIWLLTPDSIEKRARAVAKDTAKADFVRSS